MLPVGVVYAGSLWGILASSCDNRGMIAARRCGRPTGISAHLSSRAWWSSTRFWGQVVHNDDSTASFIPHMIYGVPVWRSCRLLHLGVVLLLKEIKDYPSTVTEVCCYPLGSDSPRNAAWQMALRCFEKCRRAHYWGICWGGGGMDGSQQGIPYGSVGTITIGQEPVVDGFPASLHSIQIPHPRRQEPSTYGAVLLDHPEQSTVLMRYCHPRVPHELAWHQSSSGSMPPEDGVDSSTSPTHTTSNSTLRHALTGKCMQFMPNTYRGWIGHY